MQQEIFKDIQEYVGIYQVSNYGRIKSLSRLQKIHHGNYITLKERFLKPGIHRQGYLLIVLCKNGICKTYQVHRLVAKYFIPNLQNKPEVNHKNGKKEENHIWNLEWCTPSENQKHAIKNGFKIPLKGEKVGTSKLTEKQILEIRNLFPKINQLELSYKYNVSRRLINYIINKKFWQHI